MEEQEQSNYYGLLGCLALVALFAVALVFGVAGSVVYFATDQANQRAAQTATAEAVAALAALATPTPTAPLAATPVVPPPTRAAPPVASGPSVNRLVVVSLVGQLFTVNPDGSDVRQLTSVRDDVSYLFPAWSPDSDHIAAVGSDRRGTNSGVYVFEDNAQQTPLRISGRPNGTPIYLYWAPDGDSVSYIAPRRGTALLDLHIAPRDGSAASRVLASGQPLYWDWAADGSALVINTARSVHAGFAYVPPADGEVGPAIAQVGRFQSPDISADDRYIAYVEDGADGDLIVIADRFSGEQVSVPHRGFASLGWSPAANILAYLAPTPFDLMPLSGALHLLDVDGNARLLSTDSTLAFFWSPDGRYLTYISIASFRSPSPEASLLRTARFAPSETLPTQSSLMFELWALDLIDGEKRLLATFTPTTLFVQQFAPYFDQYARSHSLWAPDSSALVLPINDNGRSMIYRFPLDGTRPTAIMPGEFAAWSRR